MGAPAADLDPFREYLMQARAAAHRDLARSVLRDDARAIYAPQMTEVAYRGHAALLWKTDYARLYLEQFPELELVREERLRYLDNENIDAAFLLRVAE